MSTNAGRVVLSNTPVLIVPGNNNRKRLLIVTDNFAHISFDFNTVATTPIVVTNSSPLTITNYLGPIWARIPPWLNKVSPPVIPFISFLEEVMPELPQGFIPVTAGFPTDSNGYLNLALFNSQASGPIVSDPCIVGKRSFTVQVSSSGAGGYSLQGQGSLDGVSFYNMGASINKDGLYLFDGTQQSVPVNQFQLNLTSPIKASGTLTALISTV